MNEQGTAEWHADRAAKITASNFAKIMANGRSLSVTHDGKEFSFGAGAVTYMNTLITEAFTGVRPDIEAPQLDWGNLHEPEARERYELMRFVKVKTTGHIDSDFEGVGGSPDGLVLQDGLIEIKCPYNPVVHLQRLEEKRVPTEYIAQIQGYLWLTGRQWCDYLDYDPRWPLDKQVMICRIPRNADYIAILQERVLAFRELYLRKLKSLGYENQV